MAGGPSNHTNQPSWFSWTHYSIIAACLAIVAGNLTQQILLFHHPDLSTLQTRYSDALVPPGVTICVFSEQYAFDVKIYGQESTTPINAFTVNDKKPLQDTFGNLITKCWVFYDPNFTVLANPPQQGTDPITLTYIRTFNSSLPNPSANDAMYLSIWDGMTLSPDSDQIFDFTYFSKVHADVNRGVSFTRKEHNFTDGSSIASFDYQITELFRDQQDTNTVSATSSIVIQASTFEVQSTVDSKAQNWFHFLAENLNLITSVWTAYHIIWGMGKYAPWGLFHRIVGYFPTDHVKSEYLEGERLSSMPTPGSASGSFYGKDDKALLTPKGIPQGPPPPSNSSYGYGGDRHNSVYVDSNNVLVTRHVALEERLRVYLARWDGEDRDFLRWLPWRHRHRQLYNPADQETSRSSGINLKQWIRPGTKGAVIHEDGGTYDLPPLQGGMRGGMRGSIMEESEHPADLSTWTPANDTVNSSGQGQVHGTQRPSGAGYLHLNDEYSTT